MSKIRIVYATKTKHSRKLAEAIGKELGVRAENIMDRPVLKGVDLLFIVGGVYGGESMPEMLAFAGNLDSVDVKRAALVTSCLSKRQYQDSVRKLLGSKGIAVIDEMLCQGSFLFFGFGHPDKAELEQAKRYAKGLAEKAHESL
ncbi:MAG: flavodoxin domain-containing protein [Bacillota bacterium]